MAEQELLLLATKEANISHRTSLITGFWVSVKLRKFDFALSYHFGFGIKSRNILNITRNTLLLALTQLVL